MSFGRWLCLGVTSFSGSRLVFRERLHAASLSGIALCRAFSICREINFGGFVRVKCFISARLKQGEFKIFVGEARAYVRA